MVQNSPAQKTSPRRSNAIGVEKSAYHHLSQIEIGGDNPCSRHLSGFSSLVESKSLRRKALRPSAQPLERSVREWRVESRRRNWFRSLDMDLT